MRRFGVRGCGGRQTVLWRKGERYFVMSSSSFVVTRFRWVGPKVDFAGYKLSGGIMEALYSYSTSVEVGRSLESRLAQRSSLS